MVKKAEFSQQRLLFVVGALRELLADENFTNLLRAEGLVTLPKYLADRVCPPEWTLTSISVGFALESVSIALGQILPSRKLPEGLGTSRKFKQIRASIQEVGLIEPLSVTPQIRNSGQHLLLDGHMRLIAMRDLGYAEATCLVATDDEAYTYNNRINRLSTIQEHFMLRRAIERGVSQERLAKALNVDVSSIIKKMNLLEGICAEALELLKDRQFSPEISRVLRKMKPTRQLECVELMVSATRSRSRTPKPCWLRHPRNCWSTVRNHRR